jgi:hypothetical protein
MSLGPRKAERGNDLTAGSADTIIPASPQAWIAYLATPKDRAELYRSVEAMSSGGYWPAPRN